MEAVLGMRTLEQPEHAVFHYPLELEQLINIKKGRLPNRFVGLVMDEKDTREAEAVVPLPPPEEDWRTHTTHKGSNNDYPSISYYQKNERVWYTPAGDRGLRGPYTIVSHEGNEMYVIKDEATGQTHSSPVSKGELQRA